MGYTIKELADLIDRKPAMIYNYFKEDKAYYFSHRQARNKGGFIYDDEVLARLKKRIGVEGGEETRLTENAVEEIPNITAPLYDETRDNEIKDLENKITVLENENQELRGEVARLKNENQELIKQNGAILLLLTQEKSEKQALLPSPKKTIIERIKGVFSKQL